MNRKKVVLLISISVLIVCIIIFCLFSIGYTDSRINGYDGMFGIVRINILFKNYVKISDEPLQYLIRDADFDEKFPQDFFEEWYTGGSMISGQGKKDGIDYIYRRISFTDNYCVVELEKKITQ